MLGVGGLYVKVVVVVDRLVSALVAFAGDVKAVLGVVALLLQFTASFSELMIPEGFLRGLTAHRHVVGNSIEFEKLAGGGRRSLN